MENVAGGSLDNFWRSYGGRLVPISTAIDLIKQVCRGVAQAHREKPPIMLLQSRCLYQCAHHFLAREEMNPSALISDFRFLISDLGEDEAPDQNRRQDSQNRRADDVR